MPALTAVDLGLTAIAACLVWWASTGLILSLIGRSERTYRWSMLGAVLLAVGAIGVVIATRRSTSVETALTAFTAAIVLWGAIEMAFLMGYVVGPSKAPCPKGVTAVIRFKAAWAALAYHEIALAAVLLLLMALLYSEPNPVALHIFALLWLMRLSTKINIFLGVSNASEDLLPARIAHLRSHFRKAPMNSLFPWSVTIATAMTLLFTLAAIRPDATPHDAASAALLATFAGLAVLEHWLLVLPLPSTALWPWARRHTATTQATPATMVPAIAGDR